MSSGFDPFANLRHCRLFGGVNHDFKRKAIVILLAQLSWFRICVEWVKGIAHGKACFTVLCPLSLPFPHCLDLIP